MSRHYGDIAFTDHVRDVQSTYGSDEMYANPVDSDTGLRTADALGAHEVDFLSRQDGFYLSTVSETGWPYVQFRGGPPGFVRTIDEHTIGWADFQGNLQYVSTGNLATNDRVAIIAVDYAFRRRLKIYGRARVVRIEDDEAAVSALADDRYNALVERAVFVTVDAFDWNCPQHITRKFTTDQVETAVTPLRERIAELEAENEALRAQQHTDRR